MLKKDAGAILIDVEIILLAFSESNSQEKYVLLLDDLNSLIASLREATIKPRPKKKTKLTPFNYGAANTRLPGGPNVTTRPRPDEAKGECATDGLPPPLPFKPTVAESEVDTVKGDVITPQPLPLVLDAKGGRDTDNTLRRFPPQPFVTEEAEVDTAEGDVVTLQPLPLVLYAKGGCNTDSTLRRFPPQPFVTEEAEVDTAKEGGVITPQPLSPWGPEPLEIDNSAQENTATSQALCTRLAPEGATGEPFVSGKAPIVSTPQPLGLEFTSGANTTALTLTTKPDSPSVALNFEQTTAEDTKHGSALKVSDANLGFKANTGSAPPTTRQKLQLEIEDCKKCYHGTNFILKCDDFTECVQPNEIDDFFRRFGETVWLGDRQTMPLIHSFNWPSTTLVLRNSYAPVSQNRPEAKSASTKTRWPLTCNHQRIILPYCYANHWTLFDIDLLRCVIYQYDSLADNEGRLGKLVPLIEERLTHAMAEWNNQDRKWSAETKVPHVQENNDDCGIFMVHNAHCLATRENPSQENVTGIGLRYQYLVRLRFLEHQGRADQQVTEAVLGQSFKLKRRRVPDDIPGDIDNRQAIKTNWVPPSHLGPEKVWLEVRDYLVVTVFGEDSAVTLPERQERAEELLHMIEAIGCADVFAAWDSTITQGRSYIKLNASPKNLTKTICQLMERTQTRTFKDKIIMRIGKWIFTMKILQDIDMMRREAAVPREDGGKAPADGRGHALFQAIERFLDGAYPGLSGAARETMHKRYREWWSESKIWVRMFNLFGPAVLLLIPDGHCTKGGQSISNRHFVRITSREREPFIEALRILRTDLLKTVLELDQQLEVLRDDVAALLDPFRSNIETKQSTTE